MELRTTFNIEPSSAKITYRDRTMFIGSCFASSIGSQMQKGKMAVMINPAGTVYNPVSVCNTLDMIMDGREFKQDDLYFHDGMWLSLLHYTNFSSEDPDIVLEKINDTLKNASIFLQDAGFLFITFGTARIYIWKKTGTIVSNCHKIPSIFFSSELLSVNEIVDLWTRKLDGLASLFPHLKVIFTISPVRHLKDSAHGNQVSKSVLFLVVEELLKHSSKPQYFPAFELMMDDLRDYRFYDDDMIHPSAAAIDYIWDSFSKTYFEDSTGRIWNEAMKIFRACNHRFQTDSPSKKKIFAEKILKQISELESKIPSLRFSEERDYFMKLLNE
jgi:hypothetical protein